MGQTLIAPGFIEDALRPIRERGLNAEPILRGLNVAEPVTALAYGQLWWRIADAIDDEFFGLGNSPMRRGSFELLCHCVMTSQTLEEALQRTLKFLAVVLDRPRARLHINNQQAVLKIEREPQDRSGFAYRTFFLIVLGIACWLIAKRIPIQRVEFACRTPPDRKDYGSFFGQEVIFESTATLIGFDQSYLTLPIVRRQEDVAKFIAGAPANILVRYQHDQNMTQQVRGILKGQPPLNWPAFSHIASSLMLSPSILRRRLKSEGQTYSAIKDEIRIGLAKVALHEASLTVAELAVFLGYSEPSAFYRAYRKLTGMTPRQSGIA